MARNDIEGGKETCPVVAHMGLVSRPVIPASVQPCKACAVAGVQARVCPTAMERAAGPRAFVKRLGRVLHYAAKTLKMVS